MKTLYGFLISIPFKIIKTHFSPICHLVAQPRRRAELDNLPKKNITDSLVKEKDQSSLE